MSQFPFPEMIDNTFRSAYRKCERNFFYMAHAQIASKEPSIHLHAGAAFAKGLEDSRKAFYEQGKSQADALRVGLESIITFYGPIQLPPARTGDKSLDNVVRAFDSYNQRYPLGVDPIQPFKTASGQCMIEFNFSMPTEVKHPVTGNPILYGGRSDMIGAMRDALWVTDEKTTTALGDTWANQWRMDSQFTGYIKAARDYGYPVAGALIRGVGLLKTKISHAECILQRSDWEIERWWEQLHKDIRRMIQDWENEDWGYALDKGSCNAYGGCTYHSLCETPNPAQWAEVHFRRRIWDPMAKDHGESLLENKEAMAMLTAPDLEIPELTDLLKGSLK